jgi:hypothetical protein
MKATLAATGSCPKLLQQLKIHEEATARAAKAAVKFATNACADAANAVIDDWRKRDATGGG